jgi:hypothetical protein
MPEPKPQASGQVISVGCSAGRSEPKVGWNTSGSSARRIPLNQPPSAPGPGQSSGMLSVGRRTGLEPRGRFGLDSRWPAT